MAQYSCWAGQCCSLAVCSVKWGLRMTSVAVAVGILVLLGFAGFVFVLRTSKPHDSADKS